MFRGQETTCKSQFFPSSMGFRNQIQVVKFGSKYFLPAEPSLWLLP